MSCRKGSLLVLGQWLAAWLASACGATTPTPTVRPPETVPPAATATPFPPTASPTLETWDYVVMGVFVRSAISHVPSEYADYIERDQGVRIVLNEWERWEAEDILMNLRINEDLRTAIREAEVITFDYSIDWVDIPETLYRNGLCGGPDNQDCLREGVQQAEQDWLGIIDLIIDLHTGSPVLLRTVLMGDWFYDWQYIGPMTAEQKQVLLSYYHEFQAFMEGDAASRGIPVIRIFPEPYFNDENPPAEYLQSDGIHLSEQGSIVVAEQLRALGYQFATIERSSGAPTATP